jgi:hypothetical protein
MLEGHELRRLEAPPSRCHEVAFGLAALEIHDVLLVQAGRDDRI